MSTLLLVALDFKSDEPCVYRMKGHSVSQRVRFVPLPSRRPRALSLCLPRRFPLCKQHPRRDIGDMHKFNTKRMPDKITLCVEDPVQLRLLFMIFSRMFLQDPEVFFGEHQLRRKPSHKCLGVHLDERLNFSHRID